MKAVSKVEESTQVEMTAFKLELPSVINVTATHSIPVSKTRTVLVYEHPAKNDKGDLITHYHAVSVITKTGATGRDHYYNRPSVFINMFELKQYIIDTSAALNVKKKTRKVVEEDSTDDA